MTPAEENTWRALSDAPEIVTSYWCYFGIHKWIKWSAPKKSSSSIFTRQDRHCVHCNKYQERKVDR